MNQTSRLHLDCKLRYDHFSIIHGGQDRMGYLGWDAMFTVHWPQDTAFCCNQLHMEDLSPRGDRQEGQDILDAKYLANCHRSLQMRHCIKLHMQDLIPNIHSVLFTGGMDGMGWDIMLRWHLFCKKFLVSRSVLFPIRTWHKQHFGQVQKGGRARKLCWTVSSEFIPYQVRNTLTHLYAHKNTKNGITGTPVYC